MMVVKSLLPQISIVHDKMLKAFSNMPPAKKLQTVDGDPARVSAHPLLIANICEEQARKLREACPFKNG